MKTAAIIFNIFSASWSWTQSLTAPLTKTLRRRRTRLSEIQNGFPGLKPFSAMLAYSSNAKFSQNLPDQTKFYRTYPSVLRISESLLRGYPNKTNKIPPVPCNSCLTENYRGAQWVFNGLSKIIHYTTASLQILINLYWAGLVSFQFA